MARGVVLSQGQGKFRFEAAWAERQKGMPAVALKASVNQA